MVGNSCSFLNPQVFELVNYSNHLCMKKFFKFIFALLFFLAIIITNKIAAQPFENYFKGGEKEFSKVYNAFLVDVFFAKRFAYFKPIESFTSNAYAVIEPIKSDTLTYSVYGSINGTRYTVNDSLGICLFIKDFIAFIKPNLMACKATSKLPILIPFTISIQNGIRTDTVPVTYRSFTFGKKENDNFNYGGYYVFKPIIHHIGPTSDYEKWPESK